MNSREYEDRQRQYEIDRITARYAAEARAGRAPDPKVYLARHPQYAAEIADFIATYHLSLVDWPGPEETAIAQLSPALARALDALQMDASASVVAPVVTLAGLADRSFDVGLDPERLAAMVRISPSFLDQLDARAIAVSTIPRELFRRLAEALDVTIEAVSGFLGANAQAGGAFYHAGAAPSTSQDDFLIAVEASDDLDPAVKAEWRAISASEQNS